MYLWDFRMAVRNSRSDFSHSKSATWTMKFHWWKSIWLDERCFSLEWSYWKRRHFWRENQWKQFQKKKDLWTSVRLIILLPNKQSHFTKNTARCKTTGNVFGNQEWTTKSWRYSDSGTEWVRVWVDHFGQNQRRERIRAIFAPKFISKFQATS